MAKSILIAVTLNFAALTTARASIPPDAMKSIAFGFLQGFVSDSPDIMTCGKAAVGELANFEQAMGDLKKGITSMNLTEVENAIDEIADAVSASPDIKAACKPLKSDLKNLKASLKQIHGPKDLIVHMLDNMVDDGEKIFDELAVADKVYKAGQDYMTAGQNLGMAFRRMLVGEMDNSTTPAPPIKGCRENIMVGLGIGFISDSINTVNCTRSLRTDVSDLKQTAKDLGHSIMHMNVTGIAAAIREISDDLVDTQHAAAVCKGIFDDVHAHIKAILMALKKIHGPKDLVEHIVSNVFEDGQKIFGELAEAADARKEKHCLTAGHDMGMAFRRTLVGEAAPNWPLFVV